jgi:hypothetical protein
MRRILLLCIIAMWTGACASTAPPSTHPAGADSAQVAVTSDSPRGGNVDPSGGSADVISVADVPQVQAVDAAPAAPKRECRREKPTGSHRYRRVCFTRSEVENSTMNAREVFGELHRQQQLPPGN